MPLELEPLETCRDLLADTGWTAGISHEPDADAELMEEDRAAARAREERENSKGCGDLSCESGVLHSRGSTFSLFVSSLSFFFFSFLSFLSLFFWFFLFCLNIFFFLSRSLSLLSFSLSSLSPSPPSRAWSVEINADGSAACLFKSTTSYCCHLRSRPTAADRSHDTHTHKQTCPTYMYVNT